jgi:hypothetical protein
MRNLDVKLNLDTKEADNKLKTSKSAFERLSGAAKVSVGIVKEVAKVVAGLAVSFGAAIYGLNEMIKSTIEIKSLERAILSFGTVSKEQLEGFKKYAIEAALEGKSALESLRDLLNTGLKFERAEQIFKIAANGAALLGLRGEEASNHIQSVVDKIKELRQSKKTFLELNDVISVISDKQMPKLVEIISKVSGKPIKDVIKMINSGRLPVELFNKSLEELSKSTAAKDLADKTMVAMKQMDESILNFKNKFLNALFGSEEGTAKFYKVFSDNFDKITKILEDPKIQNSIRSIGEAFQWVVNNGFSLFVSGIIKLGESIVAIKENSGIFITMISVIGLALLAVTAVLAPMTLAIFALSAAIGVLIVYFGDLIDWVKKTGSALGDFAFKVIGGLMKAFNDAEVSAISFFETVIKKIDDLVKKVPFLAKIADFFGFDSKALLESFDKEKTDLLNRNKAIDATVKLIDANPSLKNPNINPKNDTEDKKTNDTLKQLQGMSPTVEAVNKTNKSNAPNIYSTKSSDSSKSNTNNNNVSLTFNITKNDGEDDVVITKKIEDAVYNVLSKYNAQSI